MVYFVYSCGSNGKFQLGTGDDGDLTELKPVFESEVGIKKIVCGGNHTFILLVNGDLFASGDNAQGQCGVRDGDTIGTFTEVPKLNGAEWTNCCAGYEFSILVNALHEIYSCGFGPKGELGIGEKVTIAKELSRVSLDLRSDIKEVKSCLDHTILLTEDGSLYGWGNGRSGKLGEPKESKVWLPRRIQLGFKVVQFDVGRDFTIVSTGDNLRLLGKDKFDISGQLLSITDFKDFKTMWSSVHLVNAENNIVSIGNNSHGQLLSNPKVQFDQFEMGSEHGIILQHGQVVTWGWGEHGNCGINKTDSVTFDYLNVLYKIDPSTEEPVLIKGGCATTWLVTRRV